MATALIGLGSNLGDRRHTLDRAVELLRATDGIARVTVSRYLETLPVGGPAAQDAFLNAVARVECNLGPRALLDCLLAIENQLGRQRGEHWGPRTLDLDLLLYDDLVSMDPQLSVPHPRMAFRRFVLQPASEVATEIVHPLTGWTIAQLLTHLDSTLPYVALAGPIGAGKSSLGRSVSAAGDVRLIAESIEPAQLSAFYADPAALGWATECRILAKRAEQLAALPQAAAAAPTGTMFISDFWFDQSLVFAQLWLPAGELESFVERWQQAQAAVPKPRFTAFIDAPVEKLLVRIAQRGRSYEQNLSGEWLEKLRVALGDHARHRSSGPLLWLDDLSLDDARTQLSAAIAASQ